MDREKVIKGLECCASMNGSACRECPYSSECIACEATYQTGTAHLAADALALLKEQEAVKIEVKKINNSGRCGRCPNCLMELNEVDYPNYCGNCGQAVKWE